MSPDSRRGRRPHTPGFATSTEHASPAAGPPDAGGEVNFTPFVGPLNARTRAQVRRFFGVPESVPVAWKSRVLGEAREIHIRIGEGAEQLEFDVRDGPGHQWFVGEHFSARYRNFADGRDPARDPGYGGLVSQVHRRLSSADRAGAEGPWAEFSTAIEQQEAFAEIRDSMLRNASPREAVVRLGFRCNQKCEFCWQNRSWPEPPKEVYYTWVDEVAAAGRDEITFSGGEPTIHRELPALIRYAAERGMRVRLQTNAVRLAKPGFARELREAGVESLFVSFHSHIAEISDEMTSARGTHKRTCAGIIEAIRAGIVVLLNCVVERRNYPTLGEHARFIVDNFVTGMPGGGARFVEYSHPCAYYDDANWERDLAPLDLVGPQLSAAFQTLDAAGVVVSGIGTCGFPPCLLGDISNSLSSMDRAEEAEADIGGRVFAEVCRECVFQPHCLGVRSEYLDRFGERGLTPFAEMPSFAPRVFTARPNDD